MSTAEGVVAVILAFPGTRVVEVTGDVKAAVMAMAREANGG